MLQNKFILFYVHTHLRGDYFTSRTILLPLKEALNTNCMRECTILLLGNVLKLAKCLLLFTNKTKKLLVRNTCFFCSFCAILSTWFRPCLLSIDWSFDRKTYTWSSPKSSRSWNPADFIRISWNPADFIRISYGFHEIREIRQISGEIWQISPRYHLWNPKIIKQVFQQKLFSWWMQGGGFHPWNPVHFTLKSGGFHPWNLADFTQISPVKSTQIIKASVSAKTLQFDECRVGDFTLEIQCISPWNLVDFTHEIWQISPRFHLWNPPKL